MHPLGFTLAADPQDNQDALALDETDGIAVVVDGAGLPRDPEAGCLHPVSWYSRALAERYRDLLRDRTLPMDEALALAITRVRALHPECRLDHTAPSATVAAFRAADDRVEYLVLCDASVVLAFTDGTVVEVTDDRLDRVVEPAEAGLADPAERMLRRLEAMHRTRNVPGGWWCCQHDPAAAFEALTGAHEMRELRGVIAASDGATRGHQGLGLFDVAHLADEVLGGDAPRLAATIRAAEDARAEALRASATKVHDDLSMAWTVTATSGREPAH